MAIHNLEFKVKHTEPVRLDQLIAEEISTFFLQRYPEASITKSKIRRLIIAGSVSMNGQQERQPARKIPASSVIRIRLDTDRFLFEKQPDDITFELTSKDVLYEDTWILIVNKPARFPAEGTIVGGRDNLHEACKRYLNQSGEHRNTPYCGLLHRLDRETSGVMLFSKTRTVNAAIQEQFSRKTIQKTYLALAAPAPGVSAPDSSFSAQNRLARISPKSTRGKWGAVPTGGDEAHTDFELFRQKKGMLIFRAFPRTGRTHQIRVHLSGLGFPILGDTLYGGVKEFHGKTVPRIMLHALELRMTHPAKGTPLVVSVEPPDDFQQFWEHQ